MPTRPLAFWIILAITPAVEAQVDPLPSWADGPSKAAIVRFVDRVTTEGGPDFVAVADRVATFDNDGTLWTEWPAYTQLVFAADRIRAEAPKHPEWNDRPALKAAIAGDLRTALAGTVHDRLEMVAVSHAGMTSEAFERIVTDWLASAKDPRFHRPYTELVYQPMIELLAYLESIARLPGNFVNKMP